MRPELEDPGHSLHTLFTVNIEYKCMALNSMGREGSIVEVLSGYRHTRHFIKHGIHTGRRCIVGWKSRRLKNGRSPFNRQLLSISKNNLKRAFKIRRRLVNSFNIGRERYKWSCPDLVVSCIFRWPFGGSQMVVKVIIWQWQGWDPCSPTHAACSVEHLTAILALSSPT